MAAMSMASRVSIMTATSSVSVLPPLAGVLVAALKALGCGPWVKPDGCTVIMPGWMLSRPQIAPVDAHDAEIAVPADRIQWIEREGDGRELAAPLDRDLPGALVLLRLEGVVDPGRVENRRVEDRMAADQALLRQGEVVVGCLDHQRHGGFGGRQPPHRAARDHDVVAVAII